MHQLVPFRGGGRPDCPPPSPPSLRGEEEETPPRTRDLSAWDSNGSIFLQEILDIVNEPCVVLGRVATARSGAVAPASTFRLCDVWLVESGFFLSRDMVALLACCADMEVDALADDSELPAPENAGGELSIFLLSPP